MLMQLMKKDRKEKMRVVESKERSKSEVSCAMILNPIRNRRLTPGTND
jgi:hypothetical protein